MYAIRSYYVKFTANSVFNVDIPQLFKPILEERFNYDTFRERPIVPESMQSLRPSEQFNPWTSDTMRALGQATNISPLKLEHYVNGYLSTIGSMGLFITDIMTRNAMGYPSRMQGSPNPFLLHIRDQHEPRSSKNVTRFYDLYEQIDSATRTLKNYIKLGETEKAKDFFAENKDIMQLKPYANKIRSQLAELNRLQQQVMMDKNLSPAEKRARVDTISERKRAITRQLFSQLKSH